MRLAIVLFDLALFYFFFGHYVTRFLYPPKKKLRALLKDVERHYRHLLNKDRDILSDKEQEELRAAVASLRDAAAQTTLEELRTSVEAYRRKPPVSPRPKPHPRLREHLEVLVVALGLAFGVRGLFLQPFKIPTGSMQPTLFGIHFEHLSEPIRKNRVQRFFDYLHYSRRYVDQVVRVSGKVDRASLQRARPAIPFFPSSEVTVGGVKYKLPGTPETVDKYLRFRNDRVRRDGSIYLEKGDVLSRGYLELGDHLFVDRTHLAFSEPKRGDVMVFLTDGIRGMNGTGLGGRFYIKRLVGLPGDVLRIRDHKLYVKEEGDAAFKRVDASVRPGFGRMYSYKGGYRGYSHYPDSPHLNSNEATFKVPDDRYFMLGDNSENSRDGRFWGTVPRENLIGRAICVWWPFSRRWGIVDRTEPLDFPSPPTMP